MRTITGTIAMLGWLLSAPAWAVAPDAARALDVGCGGQAATPPDVALLDVEPGPGSGPGSGSSVDLLDAVRLARRTSGLDSTPSGFSFSFEAGLQGWYPRGTDLDSPPIDWSIAPSTDRATDGKASAKYYLANYNDAGKIWLERPFRLKPNTAYTVTVRYSLASAAFGDMNLWRIITGVHPKPPQTRDDLTYQGDTGNGSPSDVGYVWLDKSYTLSAVTGDDAILYLTIGIWGTWESPGTYYVDDVRVAFTEKS